MVIFETTGGELAHATYAFGSGVAFGRADLFWDRSKQAWVGQGTLKTICGQIDDRIWDAPVTHEIYIIGPGFIRDRWTQPTRVNCSRGQVNQFVWQEMIWATPK